MFERVLRRLREKVRMGQYVMTVHAEEELDAEDLAVFDVRGRTLDDEAVVVVVKLGPTGKMVIVTVYRGD